MFMGEKTDAHINIFEYQREYFEQEGYNLSKIVRQELDDKMERDGADPERWNESFSGE